MEKIENVRLVKLLKKNRNLYNDLFSMYLIQYPDLDGESVFRFISEKIDPVMELLNDEVSDSFYEEFFQFLFEKTLKLSGSMRINLAWDAFGDLIKIPAKMIHITEKKPDRFLNALFSAAERLLALSPDKFAKWVEKMAKLPYDCDLETFLSAGRLYAWMCGMADLREKAAEGLDLSDDIISLLSEEDDFTPADIKKSPWLNIPSGSDFSFKYTVSGFKGFDGHFIKPPVVSQINGRFIATDGEEVFSVFADKFGSKVTEISGILPVDVINESRTEIPSHINCYNSDNFNDLRSVAVTKDTVIISRDSSHKLYVYGS